MRIIAHMVRLPINGPHSFFWPELPEKHQNDSNKSAGSVQTSKWLPIQLQQKVHFLHLLANLGHFVVGEALCDLETTSWALKPYLGSFYESGVIGCQFNSRWVLGQYRKWRFLGLWLGRCWVAVVVWEPLCDLETPSWALKNLLMII